MTCTSYALLRGGLRVAAVLLFAACTLGAPLSAQAPKITPAGDPSVNADTIYRLAVDPKDFPEEASRFLLDDGVVRLEADGTGARTYRQVIQILRPEAEEDYQEMRFSYAPNHERFTLNWIRVVMPDGTVISDKPTQVQESDVPAQLGDPIYSDRKVIRASISGVKAGTIVDFSYTTEELKPFLPGDALLSWGVSTGLAVERSRYIVDVPADLKVNVREENLNFRRGDVRTGGRRVMTWATRDLPKIKPEAYAADSNDVYMSVAVSLPMTWSDIGKWYAGNAKDRYALTPEVEAKLQELVAGAKSLDDTLRAVHRWVAQDVRYVSIALGLGGYQPRPPAEVLSTGYGDCKDKATIFVAMLERLGIPAYPVLLNSTGGVDESLPSITQFDHAIAAYRRPGTTGYEYVDLTATYTPLGELPFGEQGEFGIVVHKDGRTEEITFPMAPIDANRTVMRMTGTLAEDGTFEGELMETSSGIAQYSLRTGFANPLDSTERANIADRIASSWFPGGVGNGITTFNGKDLQATPRVTTRVKGGKAAQIAGSTAILRNPIGSMARFQAAAREIEIQPKRLFPIDAMKIFGYTETVIEYHITLPQGWKATIPPSVRADGPFGTYSAEYSQDGRDFMLRRTVRGAKGILPPERVGDLVAWLRKIGTDEVEVILVERPRME